MASVRAIAAKDASTTPPTQPRTTVVLYVEKDRVGLYGAPPGTVITTAANVTALMAVTQPNATGELLGLLAGELIQFDLFAQHEGTDWLLDMAHNICDPRHRSGMLKMRTAPFHSWQPIAVGQPLIAADYLYDTSTATLSLTRINRRRNKSRTSSTGAPDSMRNAVLSRDTRCWIGRSSTWLINSHIIPKRMGDALATRILQDFSPTNVTFPAQISIFDPRLGLTLSRNYDALFDFYHIGLRAQTANTHDYTVHVFHDPPAGDVYVKSGESVATPTSQPPLHNALASPPIPTAQDLPYRAALAWHYTQCVVQKFGHPDYKTLVNIVAPCERPVRLLLDEDSDSGSDDEPNWPTAVFDLAREAEAELKEENDRAMRVREWQATVSVL